MVSVGKKSILFFRAAKETQSSDKVVESKVICAVSARPRSESLRITFVMFGALELRITWFHFLLRTANLRFCMLVNIGSKPMSVVSM